MNSLPRDITIGITGPNGFIAGHLARRLRNGHFSDQSTGRVRVLDFPRETFDNPTTLRDFVTQCNTIVHLAGMNRGDEQEILEVNVRLADSLAAGLQSRTAPPHVIFASTTQRERPNAYGMSKLQAEQRLRRWEKEFGGALTVLVIPNVFGPGCRPFYNSVVATFCYQLAHGQQPEIVDDQTVEFVCVNDLVQQICEIIATRPEGVCERRVPGAARLTVSQLLAKLTSFRTAYFDSNIIPDLAHPLDSALYATFLSHVELDDHCHRPHVHRDDRGNLIEILRMAGGGQVFFSTTRPGVIRGNHFHTRKVEWFCVLAGQAVIRIRRVGNGDVREFRVSGGSPEFISIPPLCTHQIENVGKQDLLTVFWCNEVFEPSDTDTFYEQVA